MPVTIPPIAVALVLLLLHIPPAVASVNVMVPPAQTVEGPFIVPALEPELTATVLVTAQPPGTL